MKAAYIESTGGPDAIRYADLPTPTPKQGEVLVRVGAVALNPVDLYIRAGTIPMPLTFPFVIGCDLAGTVEAVGPGVRRFKAGDRVWGSNQGLLGRQGTFAEYAAVHEDWLYPTPAGVSDVQAAAAALVGITAHLGLFRDAKLRPGEIAFVNGGTGGVGSMVVQMTKAVGAEVIATVGSSEKADLCRTWGADAVFNYKTQDVDAGVRQYTKNKGVNVWYRDAARAGLSAHGGAIGAARPHGHHGGTNGAAGFSGGAVLRQGTVALRLRHVQRHAGRARVCAEDSTAGLRKATSPADRSHLSAGGSGGRPPL